MRKRALSAWKIWHERSGPAQSAAKLLLTKQLTPPPKCAHDRAHVLHDLFNNASSVSDIISLRSLPIMEGSCRYHSIRKYLIKSRDVL